MTHKQQIAVVGGGLGGLAAACTLAARGHDVTVLEKSEWLGGKATELKQDGFRFDMGPTILTLPSVLHRIFDEANKPLDDYLDLIALDPQWRCFFDDGSQLDLVSDTLHMQEKLDAFSGGKTTVSRGYGEFMEISKRLHEVSDRFFFWKSVGSLRDTFDAGTTFSPGVLADVLSLRMGRTVAGLVRKCVPDERVSQMIDHFTQYVGSAPDASPAVLCGIAHMQTSEGIWYPRGGTRAVPEACSVRLGQELGVSFRTNAHVQQLLIDRGRACGVRLASGEEIRADAVISNSDSVRTHRELVGGQPAQHFLRRRRYEPACSGVVLYLGLRRRYPQLLHHNFVFSQDPHEEFEFIYRKGEPAPDPTCYVCARLLPKPTWPRPREKPSTCWSIRPTYVRIMIGTPCSRPTAARSCKNCKERQASRTWNTTSCLHLISHRKISTSVTMFGREPSTGWPATVAFSAVSSPPIAARTSLVCTWPAERPTLVPGCPWC